MGEARRRVEKGLPPRQPKNKNNDSPRIVSWIPITAKQRDQFYAITQRGGWIGIGLLLLLWIVVRFVGPWLGWWVPADLR